MRETEETVAHAGSAGAATGGRPSSPASNGGSSGRAGAAGAVSAFGGTSSGAMAGGGGVPDSAGGAGSGTQPSAGSGGSPGGTGGGSGDPSQIRTWTFDAGAEGWEIREQSSEIQTSLTEVTGALQLVEVPFSTTKQFVDLAYAFDAPAELSGRTLRATIQRTSGDFVGAQLYVYGGQWVSPGFESLSSGDAIEISLAIDSVTDAGFMAGSVARIGIKLSTGSNEANAFGATSVELSEVTLD